MVGFRTPATLGKGNELEIGLHASRWPRQLLYLDWINVQMGI